MKISKNKIADIRRLHQKKYRDEESLFLVEGHKSVMELLYSKWKTAELFATASWIAEFETSIPSSLPIVEVNEAEMERISCLKTPQKVLAVAHTFRYATKDINTKDGLLLLDGISDPGNLGTIIRTADWFGYKQILCSPNCVELTNPKTIQASMGSFCRVKLFYDDLRSFLSQKEESIPLYGAFMEGTPIQEIPFQKQDMIIIGSEANGISEELLPFITEKITIPSPTGNRTESLNASIATSIILYQKWVKNE